MKKLPIIAPSVLSGDFSKLGQEVKALENAGADWIHLDVMDGHFVPNLTFGPKLIQDLRSHSSLPFDVHLMISPVDEFIPLFAEAGADHLTIHPEATIHLDRSLNLIKALGKKVGIALNPSTPLSFLPYVMESLDLILIMTVNPGFGGQGFMASQLLKIRETRALIDQSNRPILLAVDGGMTDETAPLVVAAGADVLVSGNFIFNSSDYSIPMKKLKNI